MSTSEDEPVNLPSADPIDQLIFDQGLRIQKIWFDKPMDLIVILLNNKKLMKRPLSDFRRLSTATPEQLEKFETDGIGIHWAELDEDLSLRGFIKYELSLLAAPL